ncbi:MAG: insulinase family protein [Ruminococcaceae bacterium]|nr:insulinase family protein [Oscillospiraceae bacterium]
MSLNFEISESSLLREKYYKYTHPSGLSIYVFPKKLSTFYAILGTRYGSINSAFGVGGEYEMREVPDGIAHFLEHKLFANEDGSDAFEHFSELGADANAYTTVNSTAYLFSCTERFDEALGELIDFVTHPYFTRESVEKEQGIIAEEIRMYDDAPGEACYYGVLEGLYEHLSIRRNICGSVSSIKKITPELLYECYRVFYNLSNMALVVSGDIDPERVVEIADAHLPRSCRSIEIIRKDEGALERKGVYRRRVEKRMKVAKPIFRIGIKDAYVPKEAYPRQRREAAMHILNELLFARSGELYSELFESGAISPDMDYCYTCSRDFGYNLIAGEADDPEAVYSRIVEYIENAKKSGFSREDFERAKRVMYAEFVRWFDSADSIANNLLSFTLDGTDMLGYAEIISELTLDEVEALLHSALCEEYFAMSVVYPI